MPWSSWPEIYAQLASETLDVEVVVDDSLSVAGGPPRLGAIQEGGSAAETIRDAELLVIQPEPGHGAQPIFVSYLAGECGGTDNIDCVEPGVASYRQFVDDYLDLVIGSLAGDGTAIRVVQTGSWAIDGFYANLRSEDPEAFALFVDVIARLMGEVEAAASARGVPVVDVNEAFNGADYTTPTPEGYLVADGLHLADAGSQVVAGLLHRVGYADLAR